MNFVYFPKYFPYEKITFLNLIFSECSSIPRISLLHTFQFLAKGNKDLGLNMVPSCPSVLNLSFDAFTFKTLRGPQEWRGTEQGE